MSNTNINSIKNDFLASINVMLVALPLGLGIASAAGIEPISGVISAIVGGIVCTFIRGSHVAINGPGYSIIAVIISSFQILKSYPGNTFEHLLGTFAVSGVITILLSLVKFGQLGKNIPRSVITGLLASVGVIIILKQINPGFGTDLPFSFELVFFQSISLPETFIFLISILILLGYEKTNNKAIRIIPSPIWVLLFGIPFTLFSGLFQDGAITIQGYELSSGNNLFVKLPPNLFENFPKPDFTLITTFDFWIISITLAVVGALESLLSAKAIEKLDVQKRPVNIGKDLFSIGIATIVSAFVGGMPVNVVISRSSVNVLAGARSKWSNFFQGIFLLITLFFLKDYVSYIPFPCLAAILIMTGYKLTKPKIYKEAWLHGHEQLFILILTVILILELGLIPGLLLGILYTIIAQIYLFDGSFVQFIHHLTSPSLVQLETKKDQVVIEVKGIINFLNIHVLQRTLKGIPQGKKVSVDFSAIKLIDYTALDYVNSFGRAYRTFKNGIFETVGLDALYTSSYYPDSLHYAQRNKKNLTKVIRRTNRQQRLTQLAEQMGWIFETPVYWDIRELNLFEFFQKYPIEYTSNVIYGEHKEMDVRWEISDMTFVSGAFIEKRELHTTEQLIKLPYSLPPFVIEKEAFIDKLIDLKNKVDIDFEEFPEFSKNYILRSPDRDSIRSVFNKELIDYLLSHELYHIECNGNQLVIFKSLRLASVNEIKELVEYSKGLCQLLLQK